MARKYENEEDSGINIELAKQILREEDKFDKRRFREKVKEKHREEKRKLKASKRKADEDKVSDDDKVSDEGVEDNAGDVASESEDSGPDLSWLPDPDKIYGEQGENEEEASDNDDSEDDEGESKIHRYIGE